MPSPLDIVLLVKAYPLEGGMEREVLFSNVPYISGPQDIPPSTPVQALLRPESYTLESRWDRQQRDGLLLLGGVGRQQAVNLVLENPRDEITYTHPLDPVASWAWSGARAEVWSAQVPLDSHGRPTLEIPLSAFQQRETLRIRRFSLGEGTATLSLERPATLDSPITPFQLYGYGYAARSRIRIPDIPALRSTGPFSLRATLRPDVTLVGAETIFASPLVRLRASNTHVSGKDLVTVLVWQVRNAAGTWQVFSSLDTPNAAYTTFHVTYRDTDTTATLYVDGEVAESIGITGGLFAAPAQEMVAETSVGSLWCAGLAFHSVEMSAEEVASDAIRGVVWHPDLVAGYPFDESLGAIGFAIAGDVHATVESETWADTGEGEGSLANVRLPALIGLPLHVPAVTLPAAASTITPGFAGGRTGLRHVTEDGHRLKPQVTGEETSCTITAAGNLLSPVPPRTPVTIPPFLTRSQLEFAPGQAIVRTPAGSAGNPSAMIVSRVILDPILGTAGQPGCLETSTNQVTDESGVFALADDGNFDYLPGVRSLLRGDETYTFPEVEMVIQPAGKLGLSMARKTDGVSAITHVLVDFLGLVPSTEYEPPNAELWHHGWRADGEKPALDVIEKVSLLLYRSTTPR